MNQPSTNGRLFKYFLYLAAGVALFTYLHDVLKELLMSRFADAEHYYLNSRLLLDGVDVWKLDPSGMAMVKFIASGWGLSCCSHVLHSPGFFLIFSPLALLPLKLGIILWVIFNQAAFITSVIILIIKIPVNPGKLAEICAVFLIFSFWPLREALHLGQSNFLILFLFVLSLLFMKNKRFFIAGLLLGVCIQINEIYLPVLLLLVFKKYYRTLLGALTALVLLQLSVICVFGVDKLLSYWRHHLVFFSQGDLARIGVGIYSLSFLDLIRRLSGSFLNSRVICLLYAAVVLSVLWITYRLMRNSRDSEFDNDRLQLELSFFITICFLVSPWVHEGYFVVLALPLLVSWFHINNHPKQASFVLFIITYLILAVKYSFISLPGFLGGKISDVLLSGKTAGYILLLILLGRLLGDYKSRKSDDGGH